MRKTYKTNGKFLKKVLGISMKMIKIKMLVCFLLLLSYKSLAIRTAGGNIEESIVLFASTFTSQFDIVLILKGEQR
jgi:hypothetical protein